MNKPTDPNDARRKSARTTAPETVQGAVAPDEYDTGVYEEWGPDDALLMSMPVLARNWLSEEDEEAWKEFQPKQTDE